jgi:hypothetical protein
MIRKQKKKEDQNLEQNILFENLCEILSNTGIEIRVEKGDFRGGICMLNGEENIFFLNKKHSLDKRLEILLSHLKTMEHQQFYLPPLLRQKLDDNQNSV